MAGFSNLAVELALVDRSFQSALAEIFSEWGEAVRERLARDAKTASQRTAASTLATAIVAAFSGSMTLAKTQASAEPIRECARAIATLLKAA